MEIRTLRYFLETAREGNMTRAAERLAVSQSTLSKQLKLLEEELGKKLFIRHGQKVFRVLPEQHPLLRQLNGKTVPDEQFLPQLFFQQF